MTPHNALKNVFYYFTEPKLERTWSFTIWIGFLQSQRVILKEKGRSSYKNVDFIKRQRLVYEI